MAAIAGFVKLICQFCKGTMKMNGYQTKAMFTGESKEYGEEPFEKDSVAAMFSGVELNFEKAEMKGNNAVLDLFGRFSGIEIIVPENWQVNMDGEMGSSAVENKTKDNSDNDEAPNLNINYDLKFCGVEVVNPDVEEEAEESEDFQEPVENEELVVEDFEDEPQIEIIDETEE